MLRSACTQDPCQPLARVNASIVINLSLPPNCAFLVVKRIFFFFIYVPRFPSAYPHLYTIDIPVYTTMGSIGHQNDPIQEDLEQLLISAANYSKKQSSDLSSYDARYDLMVKTTRLLQTIRSPADVLFGHFENVSACFSYSILCNANVNRLQTSAQSERFSKPVFSMPFRLEAKISLLMRYRKRLVWTRTSSVSV